MMKIFEKPYRELVKLTKDAARDIMAPLRAKEVELKLRTAVAEQEAKLAEAEQKLVELGSQYPLDIERMLAEMNTTALLRRRKDQLEQLLAELFPAVA